MGREEANTQNTVLTKHKSVCITYISYFTWKCTSSGASEMNSIVLSKKDNQVSAETPPPPPEIDMHGNSADTPAPPPEPRPESTASPPPPQSLPPTWFQSLSQLIFDYSPFEFEDEVEEDENESDADLYRWYLESEKERETQRERKRKEICKVRNVVRSTKELELYNKDK